MVVAAVPTRGRRKTKRAYQGPACPGCGKAWPDAQVRDGQHVCTSCHRGFRAMRLEAVPERQSVVTPVGATDGASPCAVHQRNASVAFCGRCGSFMCQLCRIDSDGLTLCPGCFDRLADEGALPSARRTYRDYGLLSSHLALIGFVLVWPLGMVIGPWAAWMGIKGLRTKAQAGVRISKARCWASILFGLLEMILAFSILAFVIWAESVKGQR